MLDSLLKSDCVGDEGIEEGKDFLTSAMKDSSKDMEAMLRRWKYADGQLQLRETSDVTTRNKGLKMELAGRRRTV